MPTDKQRRDAERRRQARQLQYRRERAARRRRINLVMSIIGALVVVAVIVVFVVVTAGESSEDAARTASPPARSTPSSATPLAAYPCTWTKTGSAAKPVTVPPTTRPTRSGTVDVAVVTNRGAMTFHLNRAATPCTTESFVSLVRQKFYDKTPCHRLTASPILHVLQCGDPLGNGSGGPGYRFADERSGAEKYTRGVLAMANSGANTNGSQFFIVYRTSTLPPSYTIFGSVTSGMAVVDSVAAQGPASGDDGKPKLPISITSARVAA